jgi:hypothetical protein
MTDPEQIKPGCWTDGSPEIRRVEMARDADARPCASMCESSRHERTLLITCVQDPSARITSVDVCTPISPA